MEMRRHRMSDQQTVGIRHRAGRAHRELTADRLGGPEILDRDIGIPVDGDVSAVATRRARPLTDHSDQPLLRAARGRQHGAAGVDHHDGGRQALGQRADHALDSAAQRGPGQHLLRVHHALYRTQLVGLERVDHHPGDRDEGRRRRHLQHRQPEFVAGGPHGRRYIGDGGAGVDGQRRRPGRGEARNIVRLRDGVGTDVDARRHDQLTAGQIRGRIGQLDRMRPRDVAVGASPSGHQHQTETVDLGQISHGEPHRSSLTPRDSHVATPAVRRFCGHRHHPPGTQCDREHAFAAKQIAL